MAAAKSLIALTSFACEDAKGVEHIKTWNDVNNQPMLAINVAMGFVRQPAWVTYEKDLSASSQSRRAP